jgi:DNA gyrase/topoisomerase IV subunit B
VPDVLDQYELRPHEVVGEFLALSVVESSYSPGLRVSIMIDGCKARINDTGRGMQLRPDEGDDIPHSERALTTIYPIFPESEELKDLLTGLVWGARGSLGPALANRHCVSLLYCSRRDGEEWTQHFRHGQSMGPPERVGSTTDVGTSIVCVTRSAIDVVELSLLVEQIHASVPEIEIALH